MEYIREFFPSGYTLHICMERYGKVCVGGTRVRKYRSSDEAFFDCKRLCEAMTYKCAWAKLL